MTRRPDWPERLAIMVERWRHRPFRWGRSDCACFSAACISAQTGIRTRDLVPYRYGTEAEARSVLTDAGAATLAELAGRVAARHGWPAVPVARAGRGDLVVLASGGLGIVIGREVATVSGPGLAFAPVATAVRAWSIGG